MYETEASRIALERAESPQVRDFAQAMIDAHTATSNEVKAAVQAQNLTVTLPTALDREHQAMINDLRGASGEEFDQRYLDQQTRAHQEALDELEDHARDGAAPAFKALAAKTATTVREHLDRARNLDRGGADGSTTPSVDVPSPGDARR
jgi:putative membrane protein